MSVQAPNNCRVVNQSRTEITAEKKAAVDDYNDVDTAEQSTCDDVFDDLDDCIADT